MSNLLTKTEARELVDKYIERDDKIVSTQEILDSGAVPRLEGYIVKPGKVSDSIFGGKGAYLDKETEELVPFENPELNTDEGIPLRTMVRTQRISTHDIVRGEIPFKDQILALNHNYMRRMLSRAIGTSQLEVKGLEDNSNVVIAENLKQIPFENVLRAYMAKSSTETSLYQHYIKGERVFCGHALPKKLITNGPLPYVMDTPSTKSDKHDESVSPEHLFMTGVCTPEQYKELINSSVFAFGMVSKFLEDRGIIAVDTKTEHGITSKGNIVSQDEIWTMDSSRFWLMDDCNRQFTFFFNHDEEGLARYLQETQPGIKEKDFIVNGKVIMAPRSYSKEFARGFSKGEQGYTDDERAQIAVRYIEGIQNLLGQRFEPDLRSNEERIVTGLEKVVEELVV